MSESHAKQRQALHAIAVFEAIKGLAALAALIGVVDLMHQDIKALVMALIGRFGLDPEGHYSSLLVHYAELIPQANLTQIVQLALAYIFLRFLEAYGLWRDKVWGEYLGALSGAIYVPFELRHLIHKPDWISALTLIFNCVVVAYLVVVLIRKRTESRASDMS
jgi:uncharacterized membrane protein (DUF2068 family)